MSQRRQPPPGLKFEKAVKYRYDTEQQKWDPQWTKVAWTNEAVGKGGMRDCFLVWEADEHSADGYPPTENIGKVFQADVHATLEDYMSEIVTQCTADTFAQDFNRLGLQHKVSFLSCYLVKLTERQGEREVVFTMEPMLCGDYQKHNNNAGAVFTQNPIAEGFAHWTYHSSHRTMLVCDLQGVGTMYTDPQIHALDGNLFGLGNLGKKGIDKFLATHTCGPVCAALGLPPVRQSSGGAAPPAPGGGQFPPAAPPLKERMERLAFNMRETFRQYPPGQAYQQQGGAARAPSPAPQHGVKLPAQAPAQQYPAQQQPVLPYQQPQRAPPPPPPGQRYPQQQWHGQPPPHHHQQHHPHHNHQHYHHQNHQPQLQYHQPPPQPQQHRAPAPAAPAAPPKRGPGGAVQLDEATQIAMALSLSELEQRR